MSRRVAIVAGHSRDAQGSAAVDGVTEWYLHSVTVAHVAAELHRQGIRPVVLSRRADPARYTEKMADLVGRVNAAAVEGVVEVHFNANAGTCGLHWPRSYYGRELARELSAAAAGCLGVRDGGPVGQRRSWYYTRVTAAGFSEVYRTAELPEPLPDGARLEPAGAPLHLLRDTSMPAAIIETHDGQDPHAHAAALAAVRDESLARALAQAVAAWLQRLPCPTT